MKTALIIGTDSQIGHTLSAALETRGVAVHGTTKTTLDLANPESWPELPQAEVAYLCAGITSLAACEENPQATRRVNVAGLLQLAEMLRKRGMFVVFCSSNQVFDGSTAFRKTTDAPCPINAYGRQKAETEHALLLSGNASVVRFTKVVSGTPPQLAEWRKSLRRGEIVAPFADLFFAPLPLESAVAALIEVGLHKRPGIFHASGTAQISYAELAYQLARAEGFDEKLIQPAANKIPEIFRPRFVTLENSFSVPPAEKIIAGWFCASV